MRDDSDPSIETEFERETFPFFLAKNKNLWYKKFIALTNEYNY